MSAVMACSSRHASEAPSPAAVGEPCDPSESSPCAPIARVCTQVVCDPIARTCEAEPYDPGACDPGDAGFDGATPTHDGGVGDPCVTGTDCQYPLACVNFTCLG